MGRGSRYLVGCAAMLVVGCGSAAKPGGSQERNPTTAQVTSAARADDAAAQSIVLTAQTAVETIATDANGSYSGVSAGAIHHVEPTVETTPSSSAYLSRASATDNTYALTATSASGDTFSISRRSDGSITRTCTGRGSTLCRAGRW